MTAPDLAEAVKASWSRFQDAYEPLRPDLYRFCRHLTRSPWDAEDLTQDTLSRAFVTLACMPEAPSSPRAWLFRIATNAWINDRKRSREHPVRDREEPSAEAPDPRATREAAGTLLTDLSPQERAAVVLKDVFDLSLEDVADVLTTTPNAIKAALHRGRGKLALPREHVAPRVAPAVLTAFCEAFDARDLKRLTALLLDTAILELPGVRVEHGPAQIEAGIFRGTLFGCPDEVHDALPDVHSETRDHRGEAILLWWWGDAVHTVVRVALEGERIAKMIDYYHSPELVAEICQELDVPFRTHGYRPARHEGDAR